MKNDYLLFSIDKKTDYNVSVGLATDLKNGKSVSWQDRTDSYYFNIFGQQVESMQDILADFEKAKKDVLALLEILRTKRTETEENELTGQQIRQINTDFLGAYNEITDITQPLQALYFQASLAYRRQPELLEIYREVTENKNTIDAYKSEATRLRGYVVGLLEMRGKQVQFSEIKKRMQDEVSFLRDKGQQINQEGVSKEDVERLREDADDSKTRVDTIFAPVPRLYTDAQLTARQNAIYTSYLRTITQDKNAIYSLRAQAILYYNAIRIIGEVELKRQRIRQISDELRGIKESVLNLSLTPLRTQKEELEQRCASNVAISAEDIAQERRESTAASIQIPALIAPVPALVSEANTLVQSYPILQEYFQTITEYKNDIYQYQREARQVYNSVIGLLLLAQDYNEFTTVKDTVADELEALQNKQTEIVNPALSTQDTEQIKEDAEEIKNRIFELVRPLAPLYNRAELTARGNGLEMCLANITIVKEIVDNYYTTTITTYTNITELAKLTQIYKQFAEAEESINPQIVILRRKRIEIEREGIERAEITQIKTDSLASKNRIADIVRPLGPLYDSALVSLRFFPNLSDYIDTITAKKDLVIGYRDESERIYNEILNIDRTSADEDINETRILQIRDVFSQANQNILSIIDDVLRIKKLQIEQKCSQGEAISPEDLAAIRTAIDTAKGNIDTLAAPLPALFTEAQTIANGYPALNAYFNTIRTDNVTANGYKQLKDELYNDVGYLLTIMDTYYQFSIAAENVNAQIDILNTKHQEVQDPAVTDAVIAQIKADSLTAKNRIDEIIAPLAQLYVAAQRLSQQHNLQGCLQLITDTKTPIDEAQIEASRVYNAIVAAGVSSRIKQIRAEFNNRRRLVLIQLNLIREKNREIKVQGLSNSELARIKLDSTGIIDALRVIVAIPTNDELSTEAQAIVDADPSQNGYLLDVIEYRGTLNDYITEAEASYADIVAFERLKTIQGLYEVAKTDISEQMGPLRLIGQEIESPGITAARIQDIRTEGTTIYDEIFKVIESLDGLYEEAAALARTTPGGRGYIVQIANDKRAIDAFQNETRTIYATINGPVRIIQIRTLFNTARASIIEQINILNGRQAEANVPNITDEKRLEIRQGSTTAKDRVEEIVNSLNGLYEEATLIVQGNQSFNVYLQDITEYDTNITDYLEESVATYDIIIALLTPQEETREDIEARMREIKNLFNNLAFLISRQEATILTNYRNLEKNPDYTQQENSQLASRVLNAMTILTEKTDELNALYDEAVLLANTHDYLQDIFLDIKRKRSDGVVGIVDYISAAIYNKNKIFEILERRDYYHFSNQNAEQLEAAATARIKEIRLFHDNARHEALSELEIVRAQYLLIQTPIASQTNKQTYIFSKKAVDNITSILNSLVSRGAQADEITADYPALNIYQQDIQEYTRTVEGYKTEAERTQAYTERTIQNIVPVVIDIRTVEDLKSIGTNEAYKHGDIIDGDFRVVADIDLNGSDFVSIGSSIEQFVGNFNGGNHQIKNLPQPIFSYISLGADIKNIHLSGVCSGSLVNDMEGGEVRATNSATVTSFSNKTYVGGIVASMRGGTLVGSNLGSVTGSCVGGLVGNMFGGNVSGLNNAQVQGTSIAGGLVGLMGSIALTDDQGTVAGTNAGAVQCNVTAGGLVGSLVSDGTVSGANTGTVTTDSTGGGIVGNMEAGTVTATNSRSVSGSRSGNIGGIVGRLRGGLVKAANSGPVSGVESTAGGIVGLMDSGRVEARNSGAVSGVNTAGLVAIFKGGVLRGWNSGYITSGGGAGICAGGLVAKASGNIDIVGHNEGSVFSNDNQTRLAGLVGKQESCDGRVIGYNTGSVYGAYHSAGLIGIVNCDIVRGYNTGQITGTKKRAIVGNILKGVVKGYSVPVNFYFKGSVKGVGSNGDDVANLPGLSRGDNSYPFLLVGDFIFVAEGAQVMGWVYHGNKHPTINYIGYLSE